MHPVHPLIPEVEGGRCKKKTIGIATHHKYLFSCQVAVFVNVVGGGRR